MSAENKESSGGTAFISKMRGQIEDARKQLKVSRQRQVEARRVLADALERIPPELERRWRQP